MNQGYIGIAPYRYSGLTRIVSRGRECVCVWGGWGGGGGVGDTDSSIFYYAPAIFLFPVSPIY